MRVFIPKGNQQDASTLQTILTDEIINENCYAAFYGFTVLGWEVVFYSGALPSNLKKEDVVVGWISQVQAALRRLGVEPPAELDYPLEIQHFLKRKIWQSTLHKIYTDSSTWPVFVKPIKGKQFTGKLITRLGDLSGLGDQLEDRKIWCSTPLNFVSEWRGFVRYKKLLDCRCYKGDFRKNLDYTVVESCIREFVTQPAAFSIDFGMTDKGETVLIEVNDAYALGCYGLFPVQYAKMISARWSEMVGIDDPLNYF